MLQVSALYFYPIKSLGGFEVAKALVTDRGLQYDRRWMLVDDTGNFLSQRSLPQMALLQVSITEKILRVQHKQHGAMIELPLEPMTNHVVAVTLWDSRSNGILVSPDADEWFSRMLGLSCRLVYMPEEAPIKVDPDYARKGELTSFSDGYPFLLIGQASLDDLNGRLSEPVPMNRFRPNIVISGAAPFAEDNWKAFRIGNIDFYGVKRCARCVVTTIDQANISRSKEPMKTLSTYRKEGPKIFFGQNLLHKGTGFIHAGDPITLM